MSNIEELRDACHEIARTTMWERRPVDAEQISKVAHDLYAIANEYSEELRVRGVDERFVIDAVRYLAYAHAIPPMREDVSWFRDMLAVLVELYCPNSATSRSNHSFYRDLVHALVDTLGELAERGDGLPREE